MLLTVATCALLAGQLPADRPEPAARLQELAGRWVVADAQATANQKIIPAQLLGITEKGTEIAIRGNELTVGGKLLANLTTDFSDSGLDPDKTVFFRRRPVLLTLSNGKGLLCAYEHHNGEGFTLYYPHTMGRIGTGTRLTVARPAK